MDPLTQGALGAAAAQSAAPRKQLGVAMLAGWLGGMAADLDVLIQSSTDPLLFLEYHRHFTHSLVFIPVGGLLVALALHLLFGRLRAWPFRCSYLFATLGYASHGLLDSCTSYGTQLLWPFSSQRFAWDIISIIDPLFTLPILALVILARQQQSARLAQLAVLWAVGYLSLGWLQHDRAEDAARQLAEQRGHQPQRLEAKPGFANLLVFKTIYEHQNRFYVDAVRVGLSTRVYPGESIARLQPPKDLPWLRVNTQQADDLMRFTWFSDEYVALHPRNPREVIDIRYSMLPQQIDPLWGILLDEQAGEHEHAEYRTHRENADTRLGSYWRMLLGR